MIGDDEIVVTEDGRRLRPVKSVSRAVDVLDVLAADGEAMGVTELAAALKCSKTAAYNLITTLEMRGLVRRDGENRYVLGWRLLELGEVVRASSTFGEAARARVEGLAESTGETAVLAVLDNNTIFCIEMCESRRSPPIAFRPGHREALEDNAAGRVLLAHASAGRRRRYLLERDPDGNGDLAGDLDRIRIEGHATVGDAAELGLVSVAAPVFDYTREAVAGLALIGPSSRFTPDRVRELVTILHHESVEIGRTLGSTVERRPASGGPEWR